MDYLTEAKRVFEKEIECLSNIKEELGEEFNTLVKMILQCEGRVIVTGMGKSGHIGRKISSTLSSLGTPSYFLHPAEGVHGDLGIIKSEDVVIAISNSGETEEILNLISPIKKIEAKLVGISGRQNTTLGKHSDVYINLNISEEACYFNLAPTTSTTAVLVFGDALAIVLSKAIGFRPENYALFHPKGALGNRLLVTVKDLMYKDDKIPKVYLDSDFREVVYEMNMKCLKMVNVIDEEEKLLGIITDGDLRRSLYKYNCLSEIKVENIYQQNPVTIEEDKLAVDALKKMIINRDCTLSFLSVVNNDGKLVGLITFSDIAKKGINL